MQSLSSSTHVQANRQTGRMKLNLQRVGAQRRSMRIRLKSKSSTPTTTTRLEGSKRVRETVFKRFKGPPTHLQTAQTMTSKTLTSIWMMKTNIKEKCHVIVSSLKDAVTPMISMQGLGRLQRISSHPTARYSSSQTVSGSRQWACNRNGFNLRLSSITAWSTFERRSHC